MTIEELSKLSDEELRVRCAELCGWKMTDGDRVAQGTWRNITGETLPDESYAPNYPADLNAIHEAEESHIYNEGAESDKVFDYLATLVLTAEAGKSQSATARQRCIAFIAVMQSA